MITLELQFGQDKIDDVFAVCHDWFGIEPTEEQVAVMFQKDVPLAAEIHAYGATDTETRSDIIESFAENVLELSKAYSSWPTGRDTKEYKRAFYEKFHEACKIKNVKINWNPEDEHE